MPDNWGAVELKQLRALKAISDRGTFWAAAEELNESLSTVSDHVSALEALLGQRLVERSRGRRTAQLTEAGRMLLGHASAIESRLRAAEADFAAFTAGTRGRLRVGIYQSVANRILPRVLLSFRAQWPEVNVEVTEAGKDEELVAPVERGDLDLSFGVEPIPEGPFEVRALLRDPYVVMVASGSPLAKHRIAVAELNELPMVGFQPGRSERFVEEFLESRGVRLRFVFRSDDNATVQAMVAAGVGIAVLPLLAVDQSDARVAIIDLVEPVPPRILVLFWHRDRYRQPAAEAFVKTATAAAADLQRVHDSFMRRLAKHQ